MYMKFSHPLQALKRLGLVGAVALLFAACTRGGQNDYLSAVPAESALVMKANLLNLADKSEARENPLLKERIEKKLADASPAVRRLIEKALDDPESTGIDFQRPMIVAMEAFAPSTRGALLFAVDDAAKLTDFLETAIGEGEGQEELTLARNKESKIHTLTGRNEHGSVAYDAGRLVVAYGEGKTDAAAYLQLPLNKQALSIATFKEEFVRSEQDIAIYADYGQLLEFNPYLTSGLTVSPMVAQTQELFTMNFEAGRIVFSLQQYSNNTERKELLEKTNMPPTGKHFGYIPARNYGVLNLGLRNLSLSLEYLPREIHRMILQGLKQVKTSPSILNKIDGDFTLAVLPMQRIGEKRFPQFFIAADCTDSELFDWIVQQIRKNDNSIQQVADQVYALKAIRLGDEYAHYYLAYKENTMFFLPDSLYMRLADGDRFQALAENFAQRPLAEPLKYKSGLVVDFSVMAAEGGNMGRYLRRLQDLSYIQAETGGEGVLNFTDTRTNALKQITEMALGPGDTE